MLLPRAPWCRCVTSGVFLYNAHFIDVIFYLSITHGLDEKIWMPPPSSANCGTVLDDGRVPYHLITCRQGGRFVTTSVFHHSAFLHDLVVHNQTAEIIALLYEATQGPHQPVNEPPALNPTGTWFSTLVPMRLLITIQEGSLGESRLP